MNYSRRDLLKLGAGAAALCAVGANPLRADTNQKKIPIALQLYSIRKQCATDLPGMLQAVGKMGYQGVEFAGYHGRSAAELRKMLDDNALKCCGTHTALKTLQGDALKATVEFNKILGNPYLIVPSLPHANMASLDALRATAKLLTELAAKVLDDGMRVGYHSHGPDFHAIDGQIPWEVIFSNVGPGVVMQLDIGNCLGGGGDPVAELKKFPGRAATIHIKEHGGEPGAVLGEGTVNWNEIFSICETTGGTQWYIVEHEADPATPLKSVQRCLEYLRKIGK
jgi:sugar phosphate isomerase/epimerase